MPAVQLEPGRRLRPVTTQLCRRRLDRMSDRMVLSLYEDVRADGLSKPGWDAARVASYVLAAGVHLLTAPLVVVAVT